ncbi:MAG TPA: GNAT family N-acetyltransferase [Candidatus Kapabacteria bacterium]|nr:GNAT family N-acetyltransferase [Candidatus Kapabacteria bacterium]
MGIHLRQLSPSDLDAALELRYEALADSPTAFMSTLEESRISSPRQFPLTLDPANTDNTMFGLFDGEKLIGTALLSREQKKKRRHVAWIQGVYVKPAYRNKKLGKLLIQHLIDHARTIEGVDHLQLSVESENLVARSVYESLGFVFWGREFGAAKENGREYHEDYMSLRI